MITSNISFKKSILRVRDKLISIPENPAKVCLGYALGVFLAATPFIGVKVPIAIFLTALLKWNKIASIAGVFHVNLFTAPLFYGFSFMVGQFVLGDHTKYTLPVHFTIIACLDLLTSNNIIFLDLLAGGLVLGLPMALAAYCFSYIVIHKNNHRPSINNKLRDNHLQQAGACRIINF